MRRVDRLLVLLLFLQGFVFGVALPEAMRAAPSDRGVATQERAECVPARRDDGGAPAPAVNHTGCALCSTHNVSHAACFGVAASGRIEFSPPKLAMIDAIHAVDYLNRDYFGWASSWSSRAPPVSG